MRRKHLAKKRRLPHDAGDMKTKPTSNPVRPARTKKTGRPARTDSPQPINLNLGTAAKRKLRALAALHGISMSSYLERLLDAEPEPNGQVEFADALKLLMGKPGMSRARKPTKEEILSELIQTGLGCFPGGCKVDPETIWTARCCAEAAEIIEKAMPDHAA